MPYNFLVSCMLAHIFFSKKRLSQNPFPLKQIPVQYASDSTNFVNQGNFYVESTRLDTTCLFFRILSHFLVKERKKCLIRRFLFLLHTSILRVSRFMGNHETVFISQCTNQKAKTFFVLFDFLVLTRFSIICHQCCLNLVGLKFDAKRRKD